jgi:CheY-like chemotaxis protein
MESLGGNCGVKDRSDGKSGSCFWISIPFKPDEKIGEGLSISMESRASSKYRKSSSGQVRLSDGSMVSLISGRVNNDADHLQNDQAAAKQILRVLLVDDSIMIRKTTSKSLGREGHRVEVAQNGAECLKILESSKLAANTYDYPFDVILMDLQMPVMDGLEATRRIRAIEHTMMTTSGSQGGDISHPLIIIGISANTAREAEADCMESGMDGFIEKPLRMKTFQSLFSKLRLN